MHVPSVNGLVFVLEPDLGVIPHLEGCGESGLVGMFKFDGIVRHRRAGVHVRHVKAQRGDQSGSTAVGQNFRRGKEILLVEVPVICSVRCGRTGIGVGACAVADVDHLGASGLNAHGQVRALVIGGVDVAGEEHLGIKNHFSFSGGRPGQRNVNCHAGIHGNTGGRGKFHVIAVEQLDDVVALRCGSPVVHGGTVGNRCVYVGGLVAAQSVAAQVVGSDLFERDVVNVMRASGAAKTVLESDVRACSCVGSHVADVLGESVGHGERVHFGVGGSVSGIADHAK
ncbi:MAG: hypothetical protein BWX83_00393 [Candidatus Cloacimonetes bacterium ADurb.Bin117]|nr:MAG: hypothetical protein BWX83_00393 [Candidatus Cloacimonetes bacterium ADurb.Bin117]